MAKGITVEESRELEMLARSEENAWGDSDPNDMEWYSDELGWLEERDLRSNYEKDEMELLDELEMGDEEDTSYESILAD